MTGSVSSGRHFLQMIPMRTILLLAVTVLATAGCGAIYKQPMYQGNLIREQAASQLQAGQSRQQVVSLLGTPAVADPFNTERWDYVGSRRINRAGKTESTTFTVYFNGDHVTRWEGDYIKTDDAQLAKDSVRQFGPNLARDKNKRR